MNGSQILLHQTSPNELAQIIIQELSNRLESLEGKLDDLSKKYEIANNRMITRAEFARRAEISHVSTYNWEKKGIITFHDVGGKSLLKELEVLHLLKK